MLANAIIAKRRFVMGEAGYVQSKAFTVAPGAPFLSTVAEALLDGRLIEGFDGRSDPMALARATIYVPTRRAARELRSVFVDALNARSALLPRVRPLGEFDEEEGFFLSGDVDVLSIDPPIDALERQLALGTMTARWTEALTDQLHALYQEERVTTPVSIADAFWLAADLAGLIDQMHTEGIEFARIEAAAGADVSQWWHITLAFLQIVKTGWPAYLAERGRIDPADHRNRLIDSEARRLAAHPPDGPVIVAGSTGTIPATARLIKCIATLPKGAVVLPGYDRSMDRQTMSLLEATGDVTSIIGHPQFGMHRLVRQIGLVADAVEPLDDVAASALGARRQWVAAALAPAEQTTHWVAQRQELDTTAFDDVAILEAPNESSEALAIACALRATILDPKATAALVTPDRGLARRVANELRRFGIMADDSGGTPFARTPQGTLLHLALGLACQPEVAPAELLALIKHPLARFGTHASTHEATVNALEMLVLRGGIGRISLASFSAFVDQGLERSADERGHQPDWLDRFGAADFAAVQAFGARVESAFAPMCALAATPETTLDAVAPATIGLIEAIAGDDLLSALYEGDSGAALETLLSRLLSSAVPVGFSIDQWPDIVAAISQSMVIRPDHGGHPRIAIWGALEARLQTVDFLVLGGLNEGSWPTQTDNDAFLSRAMKAEIGMAPPERRIGLAAHDFQMAMGQKRVLLSRAFRAGSAPSVASRWLQRLQTLAGASATDLMAQRGQAYLAMAQIADAPITTSPAVRPAPLLQPPAKLERLSVTEVETLRRDPYAIYARRILRLSPLDSLVRDPDFAERGRLVHAVLEQAAHAGIAYDAPDARAQLSAVARTVFDQARLPPEIDTVWWTRIETALAALVTWEVDRNDVTARLAELSARPTPIGATGVVLTGRADRIDRKRGASADIIDFKTGTAPSAKSVGAMFAPQLPLEAALLHRGAFNGLDGARADALIYVQLGARGQVNASHVAGGKNPTASELATQAWDRLEAMVAHYVFNANGLISRALPQFEDRFDGDYDHLARAREWADRIKVQADGGHGGRTSSETR